MSFYAKVRCGNCRGIFDIYRKSLNADRTQKCPYCNTGIPEDQWRDLVDCFCRIENWNEQVKESAAKNGTPLFLAEIRQHYVPSHKISTDDLEV